MIVNKRLTKNLFQECLKTIVKCQTAKIHNRSRIGNRDWVAFGRCGCASYYDDPSWPCPPIRFKENTNELFALREKEKGDWRKLTIDEKKTLYRASFRQTLVEEMAPTGQWKMVLGIMFMVVSVGFWLWIAEKMFIYGPLPESFSEENRRALLRTMLDLKMQHATGVTSKWDYEKDDWK